MSHTWGSRYISSQIFFSQILCMWVTVWGSRCFNFFSKIYFGMFFLIFVSFFENLKGIILHQSIISSLKIISLRNSFQTQATPSVNFLKYSRRDISVALVYLCPHAYTFRLSYLCAFLLIIITRNKNLHIYCFPLCCKAWQSMHSICACIWQVLICIMVSIACLPVLFLLYSPKLWPKRLSKICQFVKMILMNT